MENTERKREVRQRRRDPVSCDGPPVQERSLASDEDNETLSPNDRRSSTSDTDNGVDEGDSGRAILNWAWRRWKHVSFEALPEWLKDNEYLLHGHRPPLPSIRACIKSMFRLHTETWNIWTHLLGMVLFLCCPVFVSFPNEREHKLCPMVREVGYRGLLPRSCPVSQLLFPLPYAQLPFSTCGPPVFKAGLLRHSPIGHWFQYTLLLLQLLLCAVFSLSPHDYCGRTLHLVHVCQFVEQILASEVQTSACAHVCTVWLVWGHSWG